MKKAISLLLTAIMVFSLLPMLTPRDAFAAVELVVSGGPYYYDGQEHTVTVEVKDGTGYTIEYSTDYGATWTKDEPKLTNPGKLAVSVRAIKGTEILPTKTVTLEVTEAPPTGSTIKIIAHDSDTKAPVHKSASSGSTKVGELNAGDECTLISQSGQWFEVSKGTLTGYVYYWFIKVVSTPGGGGESGGTPDLTKVQITASGGTYLFDEKEHKVKAALIDGDGFTLEYSVDGGKTWTTTAPSLTAPGKITVKIRATSTAGIKEHPDVVLQVIESIPSGTKVKIIKHGSTTVAPVRQKASTSAKKVGTIDAGKECTYLSKSGDWINIAFGDVEGFVYYWFVDMENLEIKPIITTQPENISVIKDKDAVFKVIVKGENPIEYQWQYLDGSTWKNVASGGTSPSYSFKATATLDGSQLRCIVTDANGKTISNVATLTVITSAPVITTQPADLGGVAGKTITVSLVATGAQSYQWYYQKPGTSEWINAEGKSAKTASFSENVTAEHNGYKYYCKVSNELGSTDSSKVTLTIVASKPIITNQPTKLTVTEGGTAVFAVTVTGDALSYQWQRKLKGGKWLDAPDPSAKTAVYSETAPYSSNGASYRCVIQNAKGKVTSKTVKLTVKGTPPTITGDPADISSAVGGSATFSVVATGSGTVTYQWYYQKPGSSSWKKISKAKTDTYTVTKITAKMNGYKYRCKVTNNGTSVDSASATLTVY